MADHNEDKGNPSTADRSHQLTLTHLRQHTAPSMSLSQHPIIRSVVFGKDISRLPIELTTGWLLGKVIRFDNRVHTPASGWGHYPTTHEVIPLFISACRNTEENFLDYPRYFPWDLQRGGGRSGCTPLLVE